MSWAILLLLIPIAYVFQSLLNTPSNSDGSESDEAENAASEQSKQATIRHLKAYNDLQDRRLEEHRQRLIADRIEREAERTK